MFADYEKVQANTMISDKSYFRINTNNPVTGNITAMLFNFTNTFTDAYIYSDVVNRNVKKAILEYKIGDGDWLREVDEVYPFEFSIHLSNPNQKMVFKWISENSTGNRIVSEIMELNNK
jgi:hypothetical protein